jgi:hypothetical protein
MDWLSLIEVGLSILQVLYSLIPHLHVNYITLLLIPVDFPADSSMTYHQRNKFPLIDKNPNNCNLDGDCGTACCPCDQMLLPRIF